ncbi:hypothetical protein ACH42_14230 [Endozoicomonas sp. (ex Bugula neritina AB1)]|nr:hypothetical protein ACH42_14230 [Endozoicomonas sp. (ex Bugula neritina AB1)]
MIEEQGRVVSVEGDVVWVETERKTTCSSCSAKQGCGHHLAGKYKSSSTFACIKALSDGSLSEGDQVLVGIPENSLLKASSVVYLLPLLLLMPTLWISQAVGLSDGTTLIFSALALGAGFVPARKLGVREGKLCRVKVVRVLSRQDSSIEILSIRNA